MPILSYAEKLAIVSLQERDRRWKAAREEMGIAFEIGRILHLKSEIRDFELDSGRHRVLPIQDVAACSHPINVDRG